MDGKQEKPPFAQSYGGAQETKMTAEQRGLQGPSQEEAQKIRDKVGLAPEEVEEINQPKTKEQKNKRTEELVNVAVALATAVGGVGLAATAEDALRNTPSPIIQEQRPFGYAQGQRPDPKRDAPPAGVVFPENAKADGSASPSATSSGPSGSPQSAPAAEVKPTRVFIPMVTKNFAPQPEPETPLYLREFGAPERGVIMRNKIEQGGGNLAYVEMGDQELWNNLMYLRETYGRPDLKLEINFYSTKDLLLRDPDAPRWVQENHRGVLNYDSWAGGNGTFQNGSILFRYDEEQKTLRFYITLPETYPGKIPNDQELNRIHSFFLVRLGSMFRAGENGYSIPSSYSSQEAREYPIIVAVAGPDSTPLVTRSALWIKLDTVPPYGGKSVE